MADCDQRHSWNYHDYITRPSDHEYAADVPPLGDSDGPLVLRVSKVGGGSPGRRYEGAWYYSFAGRGLVNGHGDDLHTGLPHTHAEAAAVLAHILASRMPDTPTGHADSERLTAFAEGLL